MYFGEWKAVYQPLDKMYSVDGIEREFVLIHDFVYVWTLIEVAGRLELIAGSSFDNPLGYFVCEVPWDGSKIPGNVSYTD